MQINNIGKGVVDIFSSVSSAAPDIESIVAQLNNTPTLLRRQVKLVMDNTIKRVIIKVVDTATNTVIKEIPPALLQRVYHNIHTQIEKLIEK